MSVSDSGQVADAGSHERLEQRLVGTWRLLSWEAHAADGAVSYPFGERAVGYAVYTADGTYVGQLMRPDRPAFAGGDVLGGTAAENAAAIGGYIAYGGSYQVHDDMVIHRVEMSLFPNWIGGEQRRAIAWNGEQLILTTPPFLTGGSIVTHHLTWERVTDRVAG